MRACRTRRRVRKIAFSNTYMFLNTIIEMAPVFIRSVEINGDEKFREAPCTEEILSPVILLMQISPRIPQERVR